MRVLVGTLSCGENELGRCIEALKRQEHREREHFVLENLPEREAHERLYGRFMERAGEFDLFLKLDADMVLAGPEKLGAAVELFRQDAALDHAVFRVQDWMSDSPIIGIHMYRSRVRWEPIGDPLFTDPPPRLAGRRRYILRRPPSPLALHSPDPSPLQAFHYGLHRGLKAFQVRLDRFRPHLAIAQWRVLTRVWRHFTRCGDPRLGLALLGAEVCMTAALTPEDCRYGSPRLRALFESVEGLSVADLRERLEPVWGGRAGREWRYAVGLTRQLGRALRRRRAPLPATRAPRSPDRSAAGPPDRNTPPRTPAARPPASRPDAPGRPAPP